MSLDPKTKEQHEQAQTPHARPPGKAAFHPSVIGHVQLIQTFLVLTTVADVQGNVPISVEKGEAGIAG